MYCERMSYKEKFRRIWSLLRLVGLVLKCANNEQSLYDNHLEFLEGKYAFSTVACFCFPSLGFYRVSVAATLTLLVCLVWSVRYPKSNYFLLFSVHPVLEKWSIGANITSHSQEKNREHYRGERLWEEKMDTICIDLLELPKFL